MSRGRAEPARHRPLSRLGVLLIMIISLSLSGCGLFGIGGKDVPKGVTAPAEEKADVAYATASGAQKLDLFLPKRTGDAIPLVIAFHGGGWQEGDKRDIEGMTEPLRQRGYAVASVNYRLSGEAVFPAAVLDAKASVRWLRAHAADYGLDPGQFVAWGFSAGGHLAAMIGVTRDGRGTAAPDFNDAALGNPDTSSAVQAVVDFYGPSDLTDMDQQFAEDRHCPDQPESHDTPWSSESKFLGARLSTALPLAQAASPLHYVPVAQKLPPFYLAHGLQDCTVPDRQSTELANALRGRGVRADLDVVPGFGHAELAFDQRQTTPALAFLDEVLGRPAASQ